MRLLGGVAALVALWVAGDAQARPQLSLQGEAGWVLRGTERGHHSSLGLGTRFEMVFGRSSPLDGGVGPYVEARTAGFDFGDYGAGLVGVIPVNPTFPLWFGAGALGRREAGAWAPAGHAFLAWGSRSFNYHGSWGMVFGLTLDGVVHGGEHKGFDLGVQATVDLQAVVYPWMLLISWLRH